MGHRSDRILRVIAAFKFVKAAILILVAIGAFKLIGENAADKIHDWSKALHMHGRYIDEFIAKMSGLDEWDLRRIGVGILVYASVFIVEGIGLWLRKVWAEYLTLIITTSFVPFEIYEAAQSLTPTRVATTVANLAICVYMVLRLKRDGHWPFRR
jgi:uncharacterized membrane protein (DUF2068 family)